MDNRDWYVKPLRKRTGYVEHSSFRLPAQESELKKPFKLDLTWKILAMAVAVFVLAMLGKHL